MTTTGTPSSQRAMPFMVFLLNVDTLRHASDMPDSTRCPLARLSKRTGNAAGPN